MGIGREGEPHRWLSRNESGDYQRLAPEFRPGLVEYRSDVRGGCKALLQPTRSFADIDGRLAMSVCEPFRQLPI